MYEVAAAQWFNTMVQWQPFPLSIEAEKGRDSEIRERRREQKRQTKGKEGVREQGKQQTQKQRKRKGNERTGEERKKRRKGKERGRKGLHEQPSRKCEAPLPCQPPSATSHTPHTHRTHTHAVLLPRWSCSLCHSESSHAHTNDHFTHTNISSLPLQDHSDKGSAAGPNGLSVGSQLR